MCIRDRYGPIGTSLPRNDTQITTTAGDIILYQGNQIAVYYDTNSWNFTRLDKVDGVTQAELKRILGKGDMTAVFEILRQRWEPRSSRRQLALAKGGHSDPK